MAKADSRAQLCGEVGCGRPMRARGLCSTHYNQQHQPERHHKVMVECGWCGKACEKTVTARFAKRFCSLVCRDLWRAATGAGAPTPDGIARGVAARKEALNRPSAVARRKLAKAAKGSRGTTWVGGSCERCGEYFLSRMINAIGRFCSLDCQRRANKSRRRARLRGVEHVPYSPQAIFERDGWRCHICRKLTIRTAQVPHPRAPTIDHLIPTTSLGPDVPSNVACAHFICNATRRDVGAAQLLLCG